MYRDIEKLKFHCFTDGRDEWFATEAEVKDCIKLWKKDGFTNLRVYTCEFNAEEGIYEDVDCILSRGAFPY